MAKANHKLMMKKPSNNETINWEISVADNATKINFTHIGLVPGIECYNSCEKAWDQYIKDSLFTLITNSKEVINKKK